jgi:hypothetical protein
MCVAPPADERVLQPWLLLIHQIPLKPDYLRVKIGRRLARIGAVAVKNSVYVLPATDTAREDFQWVLREIVAGGGEAAICRSEFVDGLTDAEIRQRFHEARSREYQQIADEAHAIVKSIPHGRRPVAEGRAQLAEALTRLRSRFAAVSRTDFFKAQAREGASEELDRIEERLRPPPGATPSPATPAGSPQGQGRTWVTRHGVFVDRIASAWLIRRFIDPEARFKFVPAQGYHPKTGELRFDMFEAEYTHEGDRCTFETLLRRFDLDDPALVEIGEIVHDIDLKDEKFGRVEAAGIDSVLAAIAAAHPDDAIRLERGAQLFDELYALRRKDAEPS